MRLFIDLFLFVPCLLLSFRSAGLITATEEREGGQEGRESWEEMVIRGHSGTQKLITQELW